jgi:hypothetical protein
MIADAESKVNSAIINKKLGIKHDSTGIRIYRQAEIDSSNKFVSRRDTSKIVKMRADMKRQEKDYNIALKTQNRNLRRLKVVLDSAEKNVDFKQFRDAYELITEISINRELMIDNYEELVDLSHTVLKWDDDDFRIVPRSEFYADSLIPLSILDEALYPGDNPKIFVDPKGQNNKSLDYFYSINKDKSVKECKNLLDKESANFKNNPRTDVDLSGVRVAGKHMYLVAPFITLVLMIYLLSLLNHLNSTTKLLQHAEDAKDFPWLALFPGTLSRILLFISIVLYPAFIMRAIALASELPPDEKELWSKSYFAFFFILGLILHIKFILYSVRIYRNPFR